MNHDDITWLRAQLAQALRDGDLEKARRCITQLEHEANERTAQRDRRIAERRFTGEPSTDFGALENDHH